MVPTVVSVITADQLAELGSPLPAPTPSQPLAQRNCVAPVLETTLWNPGEAPKLLKVMVSPSWALVTAGLELEPTSVKALACVPPELTPTLMMKFAAEAGLAASPARPAKARSAMVRFNLDMIPPSCWFQGIA